MKENGLLATQRAQKAKRTPQMNKPKAERTRPRLKKVKGYRYLPQLRIVIQREMERQKVIWEQVKEAA